MRIALVSGEFPPMEGGVGAFSKELAVALNSLGHEVHIITSSKARPDDAGAEHRGRHAEPYELAFAKLYAQIGQWRWSSVSKIADLTLRHEFDVVNIQYQAAAYNMSSPAINFLPWRLKHLARTVVTFHDLRTPYLFPKAGRLREKAVTFMANQAAGAITTNTADFDSLRKRTETPLAVIPIGSNIKAYKPNHIEIAEANEELGSTEGDKLIGYFGFINQSKGADILIEALAQLPENVHLVFIGGESGASDPTNEAFVSKIKDLVCERNLADRVHWTGFVSDSRVSTFLEVADVIAMPYRDGVSLRRGTLMAVLAHGRPLVTTEPATPVPELVHRTNVWLVPPEDAQQLARGIAHLLDNPELRNQLSVNATELAGKFSWDQIASQTAAFYESIEDPR